MITHPYPSGTRVKITHPERPVFGLVLHHRVKQLSKTETGVLYRVMVDGYDAPMVILDRHVLPVSTPEELAFSKELADAAQKAVAAVRAHLEAAHRFEYADVDPNEIDALKAESDRCEKHLNEMISNVSEAIPKRS